MSHPDLHYYYLRLVRRRWFRFEGRRYRYFIKRCHNHPVLNERIVEIPIIWDVIQQNRGKAILEVGNVLSNYYQYEHDTLDKYEKGSGVINEDIVSYSPGKKYDLIVSISTLEHVGFDDNPKEPEKILRALANITTLLKPGGEFIFTVPLGYNEHLDGFIRDKRLNIPKLRFMKRVSYFSKWKEVNYDEVRNAQYGNPYRNANALLVGYWRNDS